MRAASRLWLNTAPTTGPALRGIVTYSNKPNAVANVLSSDIQLNEPKLPKLTLNRQCEMLLYTVPAAGAVFSHTAASTNVLHINIDLVLCWNTTCYGWQSQYMCVYPSHRRIPRKLTALIYHKNAEWIVTSELDTENLQSYNFVKKCTCSLWWEILPMYNLTQNDCLMIGLRLLLHHVPSFCKAAVNDRECYLPSAADRNILKPNAIVHP